MNKYGGGMKVKMIALLLVTVLLLSILFGCKEDRENEALRRIADLEKRVERLEGKW